MSNVGKRFHPPDGLLPHEEVILVARKGSVGLALPAILFAFGLLFLLAGLFASGGSCQAVRAPGLSCADNSLLLAIGGLLALGGVTIAFQGIRQRNIRYYVTTFRLVETRREEIFHEVSRGIFKGREFTSYLEKGPSFGKEGVQYFYVRLLNPESGDHLMTFKNLSAESVNALETIGENVYCQYCGAKNDSKNIICSQCGANL